jgi:type IV pilus assembly protein PilA
MKKNLKETMLDNNGFSLVELIIVIAIMAVLVGILSPQYLKYVERSRESADLTTVDEIISAVQIYSADPKGGAVTGTISCAKGKLTVSSGSSDNVKDALDNAGITIDDSKEIMKSSAYSDTWTITFAADEISFSEDTAGKALKEALGITTTTTESDEKAGA